MQTEFPSNETVDIGDFFLEPATSLGRQGHGLAHVAAATTPPDIAADEADDELRADHDDATPITVVSARRHSGRSADIRRLTTRPLGSTRADLLAKWISPPNRPSPRAFPHRGPKPDWWGDPRVFKVITRRPVQCALGAVAALAFAAPTLAAPGHGHVPCGKNKPRHAHANCGKHLGKGHGVTGPTGTTGATGVTGATGATGPANPQHVPCGKNKPRHAHKNCGKHLGKGHNGAPPQLVPLLDWSIAEPTRQMGTIIDLQDGSFVTAWEEAEEIRAACAAALRAGQNTVTVSRDPSRRPGHVDPVEVDCAQIVLPLRRNRVSPGHMTAVDGVLIGAGGSNWG
jgi:hypothetical protein